MDVLITGSSGLIGSEAADHFGRRGWSVHGVDNNDRLRLFGPPGDTSRNLRRLVAELPRYVHHDLDVRDRTRILRLVDDVRPALLIHCAAQPSHDLAAAIPLDDFDTNATGTVNLLEATRRSCPEAVFIHMSTNKVYGDAPNRLELVELDTRYDFADPRYRNGIAEDFPIDQALHSLYGASKAAADLMAQEYGRYYGLLVGVFRGGCMTGSRHSGVELHGFLSHLVRTARTGGGYTIFGHKGKQVRDQIHSCDVVAAFDAFHRDPRCGEVYNIGGGRANSASVLESIDLVERATGRRLDVGYRDEPRKGDHVCWITDHCKLSAHFPGWSITRTIPDMVREMARAAAA